MQDTNVSNQSKSYGQDEHYVWGNNKVHKILIWIQEMKWPVRAWLRWNSNTEIDVKEVWYSDVCFMQLIQHCDK